MSLAVAAVVAGHGAVGDDSDCETVVYDATDDKLDLRTMVVEDHAFQRSLVVMSAKDTSQPCQLDWWLKHNPQGLIKCQNDAKSVDVDVLKHGRACKPSDCQGDPDDVINGYVRTMLASAVMTPQSHQMSAICIELGCKAKIKRTKLSGGFLQSDDQSDDKPAPWVPRQSPKEILVIGLGSSTMALWLRKHFPDTTLHVAELVPQVVEAAPCFSLNTSDPALHLHTGDGRAFLQSSRDGQYDAILIDAFDPDASLPPCFRTHEFFSLAKSKLSDGGAISFNLLNTKASLQVLKGLAANFAADRLWVGQAPGAVGVQEVIVGFTDGHAASADDSRKAPQSAVQWFDGAEFLPLRSDVLDGVESFEDATQCRSPEA